MASLTLLGSQRPPFSVDVELRDKASWTNDQLLTAVAQENPLCKVTAFGHTINALPDNATISSGEVVKTTEGVLLMTSKYAYAPYF